MVTFPTICIAGSGLPSVTCGVAFHPRESWFAANSLRPGVVNIVSSLSGDVLVDIPVSGEVIAIDFDESGEHLMAVTPKTIVIWTITPEPVNCQIHPHSCSRNDDNPVSIFRSGPCGLWVHFADRWQLWDASKTVLLKSNPTSSKERLLRATNSVSGELSAVVYDEHCANHPFPTLSKWSVFENRLIRSISFSQWYHVTVSHDGGIALAIPGDRTSDADVWELDTGTRLSKLRDMRIATDCDFAADNRRVVTRALSQVEASWTFLTITDVLSGEAKTLDAAVPFEPQFACSPYECIVATIANDRRHPFDTTAFWNCLSCQQVGSTSGHAGIAVRQFSSCGRWFASISNALGAEASVGQLPGGSVSITRLKISN